MQHNDRELLPRTEAVPDGTTDEGFRAVLKKATVSELIDLAQGMDAQDYDYIRRGIDMNLAVGEAGHALGKVSYYVSELVARKYRVDDAFSSCEVLTTAAADARMAGLNLPVVSSGGSGNQGIVAIVYRQAGKDMPRITLAVNNLVSDLGAIGTLGMSLVDDTMLGIMMDKASRRQPAGRLRDCDHSVDDRRWGAPARRA